MKTTIMKTNRLLLGSAMVVLMTAMSCRKGINPCNCSNGDWVASSKVYATGLNNPRGLKFGPDGDLYVAEGGVGGLHSTTCAQVPPPVGPYTGSDTGARISRISGGIRTTVIDHLPSSQTSPTQGTLISGVGDIAFLNDDLYGVLSGAGCSHGVTGIPNGVIKAGGGGSWSMTADLSAFQMMNPVANPNPGDFEPDGTWYSMVAVGDDLYAVEPNHGEFDRIDRKGNVHRIIDISASQGHIVPTALAYFRGNFYIGNLGLFPITAGSSNIYKVTPEGAISVFASGFTTVLGVAFDELGALYVLENTTGNPFPTPGTGDIVRVDPAGGRQIIYAGLDLPTALVLGKDHKLYVSNWGFGPPAVGGGQILQISVSCATSKPASKAE